MHMPFIHSESQTLTASNNQIMIASKKVKTTRIFLLRKNKQCEHSAEKLTAQTTKKKIPVPQLPKYKKVTPIRLTFRVWKIKIIIEMQVTTPNGWGSWRIELLLNLNPNIWSLTNKGINLIVNWFILCDVSTVV